MLEELDARLAVGLGRVHREVGVAAARPRPTRSGRWPDPRLALDPQVATRHGERHRERRQHALRDHRSLGAGVVALDQDGELVAADAGDGVADAHARAQPLADRHEQVVAGVVTEAVVHGLEVVEVDEQHRHRLVAPLLERVVEAVPEQRPVGELRERVVERLELAAGPRARGARRPSPRGCR